MSDYHPIDILIVGLEKAAWRLNGAPGLYRDEHERVLAMATIEEAIRGAQAAIETHHAAYAARYRGKTKVDLCSAVSVLNAATCPHVNTLTDYEVGSGGSFNVYCRECHTKVSGPHG